MSLWSTRTARCACRRVSPQSLASPLCWRPAGPWCCAAGAGACVGRGVSPVACLCVCPCTSVRARLAQVPTWGHSGTSFVLHIGNLLKQSKLYFQVGSGACPTLLSDRLPAQCAVSCAGGRFPGHTRAMRWAQGSAVSACPRANSVCAADVLGVCVCAGAAVGVLCSCRRSKARRSTISCAPTSTICTSHDAFPPPPPLLSTPTGLGLCVPACSSLPRSFSVIANHCLALCMGVDVDCAPQVRVSGAQGSSCVSVAKNGFHVYFSCPVCGPCHSTYFGC
jgi:hypothetical protein